jgi:TIR domain
MVAKVFISYRRADANYPARMIYNAFRAVLPRNNVFMDVDSIPLGADFVETLEGWVEKCEILLALIGPGWADAIDPKTSRKRLQNDYDFVRVEIREALKRGIPVVPVLLDGTPMPDPEHLPDDLRRLVRRQAEFVDFRTFDADVERLIKKLELDARIADVEKQQHTGHAPIQPHREEQRIVQGQEKSTDEIEARRKAEEEREQQEIAAQRQAEVERQRREAEAKRRAEEETRQRAGCADVEHRNPSRDSSLVRKKFPTSVCRHSTSSIRKTLQNLWLDLKKSLGAAGADVAAADAASAIADAVGEAVVAVAVVAAAIAGDVAAGSRRDFLN